LVQHLLVQLLLHDHLLNLVLFVVLIQWLVNVAVKWQLFIGLCVLSGVA